MIEEPKLLIGAPTAAANVLISGLGLYLSSEKMGTEYLRPHIEHKLSSDTKLLDERSVPFKVCLHEVIKKSSSLTYHLVHTTS